MESSHSELCFGDLSSWDDEDFLTLKDILSPFIPYIRFFEISSKDFHNQVRPYKKLLPEELFESVLSFYMTNDRPRDILPPRYGRIAVNSKIITPKHAAILANWIQRKHANAIIPKDHRYNMNLIYRGNKDGFDINAIRKKCYGQTGCILIIKIADGTVIGGYNPLGWKVYESDVNPPKRRVIATVFWMTLINLLIIGRVENSAKAIHESNCYNHFLNFGYSDLVVNNKKGICQQKYYESRILDISEFNIEEMEIFTFSIQKFFVARVIDNIFKAAFSK
ncbi:16942_t:CDS:2 [Funneliformis mosseae]|uniref:16942_t:CDS:1 n=1 Tax=Funneliformis mosseae TaxID=27381 RepID=A0A9N9H0J8_FUNMO|nr:16942_t:CDS:2 [Funneliformis mosseae]